MFFKKRVENKKIINRQLKGSSGVWKKKYRENHDSGFWSRLFFRIILLLFLGAVIYILFFSRFLLVNSVEVEGAVNVDASIIREMAQKEIEGSYLKYLQKSNFIILNAKEIRRDISSAFKIIEKVETKIKFPDKLIIKISEREPALIVPNDSKCFVVDNKGMVFDEIECGMSYFNQEISVLVNEKNKEITLGENYLDPEYIDFISVARSEMENELEIKLEKEMRTPSIISSDIRMKTQEGWMIYLNEKLSARKELEMFQVVLENKINPEQRKDLEYIDLRTENKVFYKFKNAQVVADQESEQKEKIEDIKKKK